MVKAVSRFLLRNPTLVLVGMGLLTVLSCFMLPKLRFDFSPQAVYAGSNGFAEFMEQHREQFGHEDTLVIVTLESLGEQDALAADAINWIDEFGRQARDVEHVVGVESIATLKIPRIKLGKDRGVSAVPIISSRPVDADAAEMIRFRIDDYPLINGIFLSEDRRLSTVSVAMNPKNRDMDSLKRTVPALENIVKQNPPPPDYKVHINGVPAIRVDIVRNLQSDQIVMFPAAGSLFLLVSFLMFRSIKVTVVTLAGVIMGVFWTFALIAIFDLPFTLLTNVVPTLLLIIGAANCVHLTSRFVEDVARAGGDVKAGLESSFPEMILTCGLTFGTTAIGFGSLLASQSDILRLFSVQVMLGLFCQYFSVLLTTAMSFPYIQNSLAGVSVRSPDSWVDRFMMPIGRYVSQNSKTVLLCTIVLVIAALGVGSRMRVNSYMFEMYRDSHPTMQTLRLLEERMSGVISLEVNLKADTKERLFEPQTVRRIHSLRERALANPQILYSRSYVDIHQAVYAVLKRRPELTLSLPDSDEELVEAIRKSGRLIEKLDNSAAYNSFVTADKKNARILMRVNDGGTLAQNILIDELEADLAKAFPPDSGIEFRVTGDMHLHARCMDGFVRDLLGSLLTASLIIFGVISLLFRSLRIGLISAIPNITPLLITLGYMVFCGYDMTVSNVIVFAIGLGIAVDDTIHFLARFKEETRKTDSVQTAIQNTFDSSGRAIVLTTVLIVCGLSVLVLSDFIPTVRFAELTGITMASALLGDLMLLPACLMLFWKNEPTANADYK